MGWPGILALTLATCIVIVVSSVPVAIVRDAFDDGGAFIEVVVARYAEPVECLKRSFLRGCRLTCYNKGREMDGLPAGVSVVPLPNVGRCDHTYLHHLVTRYDTLSPVTVFLPGSYVSNGYKNARAEAVVSRARATLTTVLQGIRFKDVRRELGGFQMDTYSASDADNYMANPEAALQPCKIRPFGVWYDAMFKGVRTTVMCDKGIFAVARDHVLQHPVSRYMKLRSFVDSHSNPEAGHFIERSWGAIFAPLPASCIQYD